MSPESAFLVAYSLGFSPEHIACVLARDRLQIELGAEGLNRARHDQYKEIVSLLDQHLSWANPFSARARRLSLAFRKSRLARGVSVSELAQRITSSGCVTEDIETLSRRIRMFEGGQSRLGEFELNAMMVALDPKLHVSELEAVAEGLQDAQVLQETLEVVKVDASQVLCPEGWNFEYRGSPTIFGAIGIEVIQAQKHQVSESGACRPRIVGAKHRGYEIGIVTRGQVRLTIRRTKFEREEVDAVVNFVEGEDGVVFDREVDAGGIVAFRSDHFHRIEMLAPSTQAISVNLRRNVLMWRGVRGAKSEPPVTPDPSA